MDKRPGMLLWLVAFLGLAFMLGASLGHLLEMPNKMRLSAAEYLTVQQLYQGWNSLGFAVVTALVTSLSLTVLLRANRPAFTWLLTSVSAIAGTQVVFWTWTFPVNTTTDNWTVLPEHWMRLRSQWEYSHAAGAALSLIALMAMVLAALCSARPVRPTQPDLWSQGNLSSRRGQVLEITTGT